MNFGLDPDEILLEHIHGGLLDLLLDTVSSTIVLNLLEVFGFIQIWNITGVEHTVEILDLGLIDNLGIDEEEIGGLHLDAT